MSRRGLTLLEVLFSIFVLAIGIISILSLIPVAKSQIRDAGNSDRGSAAGMNALADIRARGYLANCRSEPWVDVNGDGVFVLTDDTYTDVNGNGAFDDWPYGVVIDPLFLAANYPAPEVLAFPYQLGGATPYGLTPIMRTTPWPGLWGNAAHEPLADKLFRSEDDLSFALPDDDAARPARMFQRGVDNGWGVAGTDDDANGVTDDGTEAGWPGSDDTAQSDGQFSWLATAVPSDASQRPSFYTVSVGVFRGRERVLPIDQPLPGERMAWCDVIGSGLGGGDIRLRCTDAPEDWLSARTNQWVLLIGWKDGVGVPSVTTPGGTGTNAMVMRWYRIAGLGNVADETIGGADWTTRYATLAGPDLTWVDSTGATQVGMGIDVDDDPTTAPIPYDADGDAATGATFQAVLFTDCIGVFERVIRND